VSEAPYREPPEREADPYLVAWDKYRRRRKQMWIVFFSWPWVAGFALTLYCKVTGASEGEAFPFIALPIGLFAFAVLNVLSSFKCPHCGEPFHRKGAFHNGFTRRCLNCRIEIGTPKDPSFPIPPASPRVGGQ
jgi:hypothetical protein